MRSLLGLAFTHCSPLSGAGIQAIALMLQIYLRRVFPNSRGTVLLYFAEADYGLVMIEN
jgi:hypothetical protein